MSTKDKAKATKKVSDQKVEIWGPVLGDDGLYKYGYICDDDGSIPKEYLGEPKVGTFCETIQKNIDKLNKDIGKKKEPKKSNIKKCDQSNSKTIKEI